MRILALSDEECKSLWDYYRPGMLKEYDLILSCGDLKSEYLRFLVTMGRCPLMYVHGNHDVHYKRNPPEGCDCIDDKLVIYKGLRILGLGGSRSYNGGSHQYTERQMRKRIHKLKWAIYLAGGVDIVLTHSAPRNLGDAEDLPHRGFEAFLELVEAYSPRYLLHGHVHMNYGHGIPRERQCGDTKVVNCWEKYVLECTPDTQRKKIPAVVRLLAKNLWIWK